MMGDVQQIVAEVAEEENYGSQIGNTGLAYTASEMRTQHRAAGQERAAPPHTESHLETLAGMLSSESGLGEAETRAHILDVTDALRDISDGGGEPRRGAGRTWARRGRAVQLARRAQQPGLRTLEHRSTAFLQGLRQ